jgi:hypothetical protein
MYTRTIDNFTVTGKKSYYWSAPRLPVNISAYGRTPCSGDDFEVGDKIDYIEVARKYPSPDDWEPPGHFYEQDRIWVTEIHYTTSQGSTGSFIAEQALRDRIIRRSYRSYGGARNKRGRKYTRKSIKKSRKRTRYSRR